MNMYMPKSKDTASFSIRQPVLKVLGLGGGGCNAVNRMIELEIEGVEFINANTDYQALLTSRASTKIQLGPKYTRGLGAGGKPVVGLRAAQESRRELKEALEGADMVFLTAGMGGGTGTGSIPVAAEIAKSVGAVTIAIVTTPFSFEQGMRQKNANEGIWALQKFTDTLITIPNDRLLQVSPRDLPLETAFRLADDVLRQAVQGITELILQPGLINVDFAHIRRLMLLGGGALMSIGQGDGPDRVKQAIDQALNHPLLDAAPLEQASGVIANFTGKNLSLVEVNEAMSYFYQKLNNQADIVFGVGEDNCMQNGAQVILVVTGMGGLTLDEVIGKKAPAESELIASAFQTQVSEPSLTIAAPPANLNGRNDQSTDAIDLPQVLQSEPVPSVPAMVQSEFDEPISSSTRYAVTGDLDIPAFLRRRRYTSR